MICINALNWIKQDNKTDSVLSKNFFSNWTGPSIQMFQLTIPIKLIGPSNQFNLPNSIYIPQIEIYKTLHSFPQGISPFYPCISCHVSPNRKHSPLNNYYSATKIWAPNQRYSSLESPCFPKLFYGISLVYFTAVISKQIFTFPSLILHHIFLFFKKYMLICWFSC